MEANKRDEIYNEIRNFEDKIKQSGPINIPFNDIMYELLYEYIENVPTYIFRRQDKPMCAIDFKLESDYDNKNNKYHKNIYINFFDCDYEDKPKREGLRMMVALIDYIKRNLIEDFKYIELTAEPHRPIYNPHTKKISHIGSGDLIKLVEYYRNIGFNFMYPEDEEELYELEDVKMRANVNEFLKKHHSIFKTRKPKHKTKRRTIRKSKTKKSKRKTTKKSKTQKPKTKNTI